MNLGDRRSGFNSGGEQAQKFEGEFENRRRNYKM